MQRAIRELMQSTADVQGADWFDSLSPAQQKDYVAAHPKSKFADHLKALPAKTAEKFSKLSHNTKNAVSNWHEKSPSEKLQAAHGALKDLGHKALHHAKHTAQHEVEMYKGAGKAIGHLASGKKWKDLEPEHKKSLRNAMIHAGLSAGSLALGDPTGHGHATVANLLSEFATHHAHHAVELGLGEVGLKVGNDYLKKATASNTDKKKLEEAKKLLATLVNAEIPTSELIHIIHEVERKKPRKAKEQASLDEDSLYAQLNALRARCGALQNLVDKGVLGAEDWAQQLLSTIDTASEAKEAEERYDAGWFASMMWSPSAAALVANALIRSVSRYPFIDTSAWKNIVAGAEQ